MSEEARVQAAGDGPAPAAGALVADLPAWGLFWRSAVSTLGVMSIVAAPWAGLWFYRWFAGRIALPGGRRLALDAVLRDAWLLFVALGLGDLVEEGLGDVLDHTRVLVISVLIDSVLSAWLIRWFLGRLRSADGAVRLGFEGSLPGLAAWCVLIYVGIVSIVGWAWAIKNMARWIAGRTTGPLAFDFRASGFEILWRTALLIVLSIPVVTIPWTLRAWTRWFVSQFSAAPVEAG